MATKIRDITSGDTHYLDGNILCVPMHSLSEEQRFEATDCGGLDAELDDIATPLSSIEQGEQCVIAEENHSHGMAMWWHSEVIS